MIEIGIEDKTFRVLCLCEVNDDDRDEQTYLSQSKSTWRLHFTRQTDLMKMILRYATGEHVVNKLDSTTIEHPST